MKICIAQIKPLRGAITENILLHKKFIGSAISAGSDAVFFPELSLTGYEPRLAKDLAARQEDPRFESLRQISDSHNITIGAGLPTPSAEGIRISMIIFQPGLQGQIYSKQQLHSDEFPFFVPGDRQLILDVKGRKIAPAICYESRQISHIDQADRLGAEIYVASIAESVNGIEPALAHYPVIAENYAMPVLAANCLGCCDDFESAGKSAVWNARGRLVAQLDNLNSGIIIYDTETELAVAITV